MRSLIFFGFLLVFGGVFFGLLYVNRHFQRPPPASAIWSPPERQVRIVSFNIQHCRRGTRVVIDELAKFKPDFVLLQEVEKSDLTILADSFGGAPAIYHASENLGGRRASWGNAILSLHPLYDAGTIPDTGSGSFGVWATAVVDNKKFKIASVHLAAGESGDKELSGLMENWRSAGSPPIIVGANFERAFSSLGHALMTKDWTDGLTALKRSIAIFTTAPLSRSNYLLLSKDWQLIDGSVDDSLASDHQMIWITARK
jgi:endonuclease/exonuclease/phosphatase family metal-dependent hydrolase